MRFVPVREAASAIIQVGDNEDGGLGTMEAGRRPVVAIGRCILTQSRAYL